MGLRVDGSGRVCGSSRSISDGSPVGTAYIWLGSRVIPRRRPNGLKALQHVAACPCRPPTCIRPVVSQAAACYGLRRSNPVECIAWHTRARVRLRSRAGDPRVGHASARFNVSGGGLAFTPAGVRSRHRDPEIRPYRPRGCQARCDSSFEAERGAPGGRFRVHSTKIIFTYTPNRMEEPAMSAAGFGHAPEREVGGDITTTSDGGFGSFVANYRHFRGESRGSSSSPCMPARFFRCLPGTARIGDRRPVWF